jgi:hypothetical protein
MCWLGLLVAVWSFYKVPCFAQSGAGMRLQLKGVPKNGLVAEAIDLAPLSAGVAPQVFLPNGKTALSQFMPESTDATRGLLLLQLPRGGDWDLEIRPGAKTKAVTPEKTVVAGNAQIEISFAADKAGGMPHRLQYKNSGRTVENFRWSDRIYNGREFWLRNDADAQLDVMRGALATIVRNRARYLGAEGGWPASQPQAVYHWIFWKAQPLIAVRALAVQRDAALWKELHFLEFQFEDNAFDHFLGDGQSGVLKADKSVRHFARWGALQKENDALAQIGNPVLLYDGDPSFSPYIILNRPQPFGLPWEDRQRSASAWLWLGSTAQPVIELAALSEQTVGAPRLLATSLAYEQKLKTLRAQASGQPPVQRRETLWRIARAAYAAQNGDEKRAASWLQSPAMADTTLHRAGDFGLALRRVTGGVRVDSLYDFKLDRELLALDAPALWSVALRSKDGSTPDALLAADGGWDKVEITPPTAKGALTIRWSEPQNAALRGVSVTATAQPDAGASAWRWSLKVSNPLRDRGIARVVFPRVALADDGQSTRSLYPFVAGMERRAPSRSNLNYSTPYPGAGAVMQLLALYHDSGSGLYMGMHDPAAAAKTIAIKGDPGTQAVTASYEIPPPNLGVPMTDFELSGQAVWQLLRGDWFDAAQIYKAWARREAGWWPKTLGAEGRADTPLWMRQLPGWALVFGSGAEITPQVLKLQRDWSTPGANIPLGVHWYNWHQNPFDNDYPHYFPAKPDFAPTVPLLQQENRHLMPYINARLWDTRDKDIEDFEFSSKAKPATAKIEEGGQLVPMRESYSSKESDGSPVMLAAMCPSTKLWQDTVRDIVLRLTKEVGTDAVYLDQIAAAGPVLCMDTTHPHPVGGGDWWVAAYQEMLARIRAELPPGKALTTECNAEPYINAMDGYLTWNWQYDGQVPLFAAVYGSAIQMFGRAYGGGPDANLALRQRAAQQLAWGEQVGWVRPDSILRDGSETDFLRRAVRLRNRLARYFYAGEMARPPQLGAAPTVTANWDWHGEIVTTAAAFGGLWKIADERKAVLLLANVSEKPVEVQLDTARLDLAGDMSRLQLAPVALDGMANPTLKTGKNALSLPPQSLYAWQLQW